jgi:hypothetical protein
VLKSFDCGVSIFQSTKLHIHLLDEALKAQVLAVLLEFEKNLYRGDESTD